MEKSSIERIVAVLTRHQVRYFIVGGLAVVAHGFVRFTADIDLVLAVDVENLTRMMAALKELDYGPRAPVNFEEILLPEKRRQWAAEKNMMVFSLFSPSHPETEIDLFLEPPTDFETSHAAAVRMEIASGVSAVFCSLEDLIAIKTQAGRPKDLEDIRALSDLGDRGNS